MVGGIGRPMGARSAVRRSSVPGRPPPVLLGVQALPRADAARPQEGWGQRRTKVGEILNHPASDGVLAVLVLVSLGLLIHSTDATALQSPDEAAPQLAPVLVAADLTLVTIFALELCLRVFVERLNYFTHMGAFNFAVTLLDLTVSFVELYVGPSLPSIELFRILRLTRLSRLARVLKFFPELGFLVAGILSAFRSVFWGMVIIMVLLLIFAMLAVSVLHPINLEVWSQGIYSDCPRCPYAFSTVWNAFLTFTQTLLFGDSWGQLALPIIAEQWWAVAIYMLAFASIGLAAMNLILAAIVESGAQAREEALQSRNAAVLQRDAEERKLHTATLMELCAQIDSDESGRLSKEELMEGYERYPPFKAAMDAMQFVREDMEVFFSALDKDGSGDVDYADLLSLMKHSKTSDVQQMMFFVKFAVMDLWRWKEKEEGKLARQLEDLKKMIEEKCTVSSHDRCPSEAVSSSVRKDKVAQPAPQQQKRQQPKARNPRAGPRRAAPTEREQKLTAEAVEDMGAKSAKASEPKDLSSEREALEFAGTWHPLEMTSSTAASSAAPSSAAPSSALDAHQELLQVLQRLGHETALHSELLRAIDRALAPRAGAWPGGGRGGGAWPENPNEASNFCPEFWSLPPQALEELPELPPSCHDREPMRLLHVGL
mmetsp:Transcript_123806/g.361474  ORF Transcript_123806/g.361474 Transcript_123806/m.361474 type:complete len:657 (-) Transcript_123806:17-1987(-)